LSVLNPVLTDNSLLKREYASEKFAADALIMLVFNVLAGGLNYLYQLAMGIYLPVEEYGAVFSLFSFFLIIWWFPQALQTPITKIVSGLKTSGNAGGIRYVWQYAFIRMLLTGLATFIICAALVIPISRVLNIENNLYAILVFGSFIFAFILPANFGVMRGLQKFMPLGFVSALWALLRLVFAVLLVGFMGFGIYGALLPLVIAPFLTVLVSCYFLRNLVKNASQKVDFGADLKAYTGFASLALIGFAIVTNIDVIIAKHFFTPMNAGTYSAISVLGRIALIAPAGIVAAMFPKVAETFEAGKDTRPYLMKSLKYVLYAGSLPVAVFFFFPDIFINLLLGGKYSILHFDLVKYAAGMFFFSISFVFLNYMVAIGQARKPAISFLALTAGLVILLMFFHIDIGAFVNIILTTGFISLVIMSGLYIFHRRSTQLSKRS
jgi:O-antigen/teichoic acid export membrane protein